MLEDSDPRPVRLGHVVAGAADVEDRARLDPEELLGLLLVGEEANVLLDRHPLLPDKGDGAAGRGLPGGQRGHAVEIDDRPHQLVDEVAIVGKTLGLHGGDGNRSR